MQYILAIDQGTTSSRAIVFNEKGGITAIEGKEFPQRYPRPGWVEHDTGDIVETVMYSIRGALKKAGLKASDISAVGITNQRETTVVWDRETGKPVYNAIVWQCRRTSDFCDSLKERGYDSTVYAKTGLPIDAYFSASKIKWILDNVEGAREKAVSGKLVFGTIDTFLMWHLSGGKIFKTDYTNASRTMLYNIHTLCYDDELLELFGVPKSMLPEVCPSSHMYGKTDASVFGAEVPVSGVAGDQQASLFGQCCFNKGDVKNTYGTGCFLLMNTGANCVESRRGLVSSLAASGRHKPDYCLEGSVFTGGAAVQWLRDSLGFIGTSKDSEQEALKVSDSGGVYVVPAFTGLGAPHWDTYARGLICGITRGTTRQHIVRATLEGIAYQVFDVLHAMQRDTGVPLKCLKVDGGAAANNFLMQFQADISGFPVMRPESLELTAYGAAMLAGLGCGIFKDNDEIKSLSGGRLERFECRLDEPERKKLIMGWEEAVYRARTR